MKNMEMKPIKRLGQNFLIDKNVLAKIIKTADLSPNDIILEIGPGTGILTLELAKRVKRIIAVEKDQRMCKILENELNARNIQNVKIINRDILKIQNSNFKIDSKFEIQNYKLIANLPYYITSPVIRKFLETRHKPSLMVLMVQKEVAQRIIAQPPHMNLLAISVQFYADPKIISYVSKNAFYPQPAVDSAIIKIIPRQSAFRSALICDKFFELVKMGFSAKRKFLISNLSREFKIQNLKFKILFDQAGLNPKCRAENLSLDDWLKLYTILTNKNLL